MYLQRALTLGGKDFAAKALHAISLIRRCVRIRILGCMVMSLVTAKAGLEGNEPQQSWSQLIERVAHGDEAALAQLYECTSPIVFGLVLRIVGDRATAEEITLDVYIQAWRQACRYNTERGAASSWLLMLARSRAIDWLRSRVRRSQDREQPLTIATMLVETGPSPEDASAEAGRRRIVGEALTSLTAEQREAIELAFFYGMSHSEIAAKLGEPLGTIKTHALDALAPDEKAAFEAHLREGCPVCEAELKSCEHVLGQLGFAERPVNPPAELRQRLLARVSEGFASADGSAKFSEGPGPGVGIMFNQAGLLISRSEDISWEPGGLPGLRTKTLFIDPARKYMTALVRMDPGTVYPSHQHNDVEELYMLEGDLLVEGHVMRPGDYCRAEPGTIHGQVRTDSGALFLVLSSQRDELLI